MNVEFHKETHTYRVGGAQVVNVTRVLGPLYDFGSVPAGVLEHKRQIGEALDAAIELDIKDELDEASIDPQIGGYFDAWRKFKRDKRFECYLLQSPVFSKKYRYAGTPDAVGLIDGEESVPDWKATYSTHPAVALQTAAYAAAGSEMGLFRSSVKRYGVRFDQDGRYFIEPYKDKNDFYTFLSLLSIHNWKARHGLLKEKSK